MSGPRDSKPPPPLPFDWDAEWYAQRYPDIAEAISAGRIRNADLLQHFLQHGVCEGRYPSAAVEQAALSSETQLPRLDLDVNVGDSAVPLTWPVKGEIGKSFITKLTTGFFGQYMSGSQVLDIGYKGGNSNAVPVLPHAIGVDIDYPGYDGLHLPFDDGSVDSIFASHVLEHVAEPRLALRDWFRVLKVGGFLVVAVPHQFLYERRLTMPSQWSKEHLRFYSPASLLQEIEGSFEPNTYRIRHFLERNPFRFEHSRC